MVTDNHIKANGKVGQKALKRLGKKLDDIAASRQRSKLQQNQEKIHQQIGPPDSEGQTDKHYRVDGMEKAAAGYQQNDHGGDKENTEQSKYN
jgi:hypothetical protein